MSKLIYLALAAVVALGVLAGCGGSVPSAADAQKKVCDTLTTLQASVAQIAAVDTTTKVADLKQMKLKVDEAVQSVKAANQLLQIAQVTQLTNQYDELTKTVDSMSGESLGAAATQIQAGAKSVDDAFAQARTALKCAQ